MRILTFDELPTSMDSDRAALQLAAFGAVSFRRDADIWRQRSRMSDYAAVFAVERGRVLGQVWVLRLPYDFPDGPGRISGIASVTTRPDRARSGIARALLEDVHRREREAGLRYVSLWTNPSWGAHRLYEKLGYRDLYSPPWAASVASRRTRCPAHVRPGRRSDLDTLDRLHDRHGTGRLGFARRAPGFLRALSETHRVVPESNLLVADDGRETVGYAHYDRQPNRVICGELVATDTPTARALVRAVEWVAQGTPFAFQHSTVTDAPALFPPSRFATLPRSWWVWMGAELGPSGSRRAIGRPFASEDPRFLCFSGDRF